MPPELTPELTLPLALPLALNTGPKRLPCPQPHLGHFRRLRTPARLVVEVLMKAKDILGRRGEVLVADYLEDRGIRVVDQNWRCRTGELDLVAYDGECLGIAEVKTRRFLRFGHLLKAITPAKLSRLRTLGELWSRDRWRAPVAGPAPVATMNAQASALGATGDADWLSADIEAVIGRKPHSFRDFPQDHLEVFRGMSATSRLESGTRAGKARPDKVGPALRRCRVGVHPQRLRSYCSVRAGSIGPHCSSGSR